MIGKWLAAAVGGLAIGLMLAPAVGQQERPGLQRLKELRGEREQLERDGGRRENALHGRYKVVAFHGDIDQEQKMLNDLAADGWEYVGLVATGAGPTRELRGHVAFRRAGR